MNTKEKFEIAKCYENLYRKSNLEELKESLQFFTNRGCNSNNYNKEEFDIHINVIRTSIKNRLYKKYN